MDDLENRNNHSVCLNDRNNGISKSNGDHKRVTRLRPKTAPTQNGLKERTKQSKIGVVKQKIATTENFKDNWSKEKEDRLRFFREQRETELKRVQENSLALSEARRRNSEKKREIDMRQKQTELDMLASSVQARAEQAVELEKQAKDRRRKSIMLNEEIIRASREKSQKLKVEKQEEEKSLFEMRRTASLNARAAQQTEKERRRQSFALRGSIAKKQKQKLREISQQKSEENVQDFELRRQAWLEEQEGRAQAAAKRRESICMRGKMFQLQRQAERELSQAEINLTQEELRAREEDWLAVQESQAQERKRSRESIVHRLDKWREEKALEAIRRSKEAEAAEVEAQLRAQEAEDVRAYQEKQQQNKRASLAMRLDHARKHSSYESSRKVAEDLLRQEEARLQQQDAEDVQSYKEQLAAERRKSLEYRNQTEFQEKMRILGEKAASQEEENRSRALSEAAWRDLKAHQERERERERKEISERLVESKRQQKAALEVHSHQLSQLHDALETRRQNWQDEENYKEELKQRRRASVAMRIESWRVQKLQEERENALKKFELEQEAILREQEREDLANFQAKMRMEEMKEKALGAFVI